MAAVTERFQSFAGREQALLVVGSLLLVIHGINHTIADETVDVAPTVITGAVLLAALLYGVLPKLIVVAVALFAGATHAVTAVVHTLELVGGDPKGGDYSGPVSLVGSLLILAAALYMIADWVARRRSAP